MKVELEASGLFVKVSMDGAPYLRKIDLKVYKGYKELREGLDGMFNCFSQGELSRKEGCNGSEFAITVEEEMSRDVDRDITMPSLPSELCTCSFFVEMVHQRLAEEATPVQLQSPLCSEIVAACDTYGERRCGVGGGRGRTDGCACE
ncbi:hypothetical protein ZIOFF_050709 [Zingiber officinale]|uniref:Auxin-responsive protein n=1 Tax=Zingiber officinale TaxID=94328 RepID=A0A8J5FRG3_ZINOF|nr:hypothetical protein ZIOFF_050709 [Zingiber officinale]